MPKRVMVSCRLRGVCICVWLYDSGLFSALHHNTAAIIHTAQGPGNLDDALDPLLPLLRASVAADSVALRYCMNLN